MARPADAATLAPFLAVVGGLILLGASAATWVERPASRAIGDLVVAEVGTTTGSEMAPTTVVAALGAVVCGVVMLATRGLVRRIVALLTTVAGLLGVLVSGAVAAGLQSSGGDITVAPRIATVGAAGVLVAGLAGMLRPGLRMPARYDVGVAPEDDEWRLASAADDPDEVGSYPSSPGVSDPTEGEAEHR